MRVSEQRLTAVLTSVEPHVIDNDPAAGVIVEHLVASDPACAAVIRDTATFLLDLLRPDPDAAPLALFAATDVLAREASCTVDDMRDHLATMSRTDLLLAMSVQSLLATTPGYDTEVAAILRTAYNLIKICEAQEEVDTLERALAG